ncbi:hypothetical protein WME97_03295 [Sorangium sp. So ce367]|uniref:hypothetical protein n=1 Tax=Sorangium sp. So ce367 TaxID=3133305 RepID=UPI003F61371C
MEIVQRERRHALRRPLAPVLDPHRHHEPRLRQAPRREEELGALEVADPLHHRDDARAAALPVGPAGVAARVEVDGDLGQPPLVPVGAQPEVRVVEQIARAYGLRLVADPDLLAALVEERLLGGEQALAEVGEPRRAQIEEHRAEAVRRGQAKERALHRRLGPRRVRGGERDRRRCAEREERGAEGPGGAGRVNPLVPQIFPRMDRAMHRGTLTECLSSGRAGSPAGAQNAATRLPAW